MSGWRVSLHHVNRVFPIYASKKQIAAEICVEGRVPEARFVSLLIVAVALLLALARVLKLPHSLVLLPGLVAGAALVVAAAGAAALVAHMLLPDLDWAGAVLLGLVVSVSGTRTLDESGHDKEVPR